MLQGNGIAPLAKRRKYNQAARACTRCSQKHCKCDGQLPCSQCRDNAAVCTYTTKKKPGPKKGTPSAMLAQVNTYRAETRQLEIELNNLKHFMRLQEHSKQIPAIGNHFNISAHITSYLRFYRENIYPFYGVPVDFWTSESILGIMRNSIVWLSEPRMLEVFSILAYGALQRGQQKHFGDFMTICAFLAENTWVKLSPRVAGGLSILADLARAQGLPSHETYKEQSDEILSQIIQRGDSLQISDRDQSYNSLLYVAGQVRKKDFPRNIDDMSAYKQCVEMLEKDTYSDSCNAATVVNYAYSKLQLVCAEALFNSHRKQPTSVQLTNNTNILLPSLPKDISDELEELTDKLCSIVENYPLLNANLGKVISFSIWWSKATFRFASNQPAQTLELIHEFARRRHIIDFRKTYFEWNQVSKQYMNCAQLCIACNAEDVFHDIMPKLTEVVTVETPYVQKAFDSIVEQAITVGFKVDHDPSWWYYPQSSPLHVVQ
mmetsp:Transcript_6466/g.7022  ORF Transcript_6466/g.7022 Transcript_6466/m.7022 type:complete len:490 (-) Transcript_6466:32-1501(-)